VLHIALLLTPGFTPDPYLSAKLSYLTVSGIQSAGVVTSLKHYILYEQEPICTGDLDDEGGRTDCTQVSADIGDKVLHELYLPSFAEGVRAGAGSVMWYVVFHMIDLTRARTTRSTVHSLARTATP
jgi:beta-glucosidase-like glycosyl hydrolase